MDKPVTSTINASERSEYIQPRDIALQSIFEEEGNRFTSLFAEYKMTGFGFATYPPANMMCTNGNCQFSFEDGELKEGPGSGYTLEGKLQSVSGQENRSSSSLYAVTSKLEVGETIDNMGTTIDLIDGGFFTIDRVGNYEIVNGSFSFKSGDGVLMLQGEL